MLNPLVQEAAKRSYRLAYELYGKDYKPEYYCPRTAEDVVAALEALLADLKENPRLTGVDIESNYVEEFGERMGDYWHPDYKVWCIGFSCDDYQAVSVPFDPDPYLINKFGLTSIGACPRIQELVQEIMDLPCVAHSQSDALGLSRYGLKFKDLEDSMLVQYALDDTAGDLGVDDLASFYTEEGGYKDREYAGHVAKVLAELDWDDFCRYNCHDADIERRLFFILKAKAIEEDVWRAYQVLKTENRTCIRMCVNGAAMDQEQLGKLIRIEREKEAPLVLEFYARPEVKETLDFIINLRKAEPKHKLIKKLMSVNHLNDIKISKSWALEILLFDVCKFPVISTTKKGARGTGEEDLEKAKEKQPAHARIIDLVLLIKKIEKKLSTYLLPYVEAKIGDHEEMSAEEIAERMRTGNVDRFPYIKADGFVHPRFNLNIARSGRSASENPNFQNIISDLEIKRMFVGRWWPSQHEDGEFESKRGCLVLPDFSQHEVRMAAFLCQDPMMIKALSLDFHVINQGMQAKLVKPTDVPTMTKEDIKRVKNGLYFQHLKLQNLAKFGFTYEELEGHDYKELMDAFLADEILQELAIEWEESYQKKRTVAKESTFGPMFGMIESSFAAIQGISLEEAKEVYAVDKRMYPVKHAFKDNLIALAHRNNFVQSIFGKKRRLDYRSAREDNKIQELDRQCINQPIQGAASDIALLCMGKIMDTLEEGGIDALGIGTVHDSLVIDCEESIAMEVGLLCKTIMEEYPIELLGENQVKFKAEVKLGPTWGDLKKVEV